MPQVEQQSVGDAANLTPPVVRDPTGSERETLVGYPEPCLSALGKNFCQGRGVCVSACIAGAV